MAKLPHVDLSRLYLFVTSVSSWEETIGEKRYILVLVLLIPMLFPLVSVLFVWFLAYYLAQQASALLVSLTLLHHLSGVLAALRQARTMLVYARQVRHMLVYARQVRHVTKDLPIAKTAKQKAEKPKDKTN
eukprot:g1456.t1